MGETGRQTLTPVSDVMLARYVAGDLHGDQLARVERAIGETPGLADRLERMRQERTAFLASNPPEQVAHSIATRLTVERPQPSRWQVWWLLPPVSVATALLIGVVYQRALGPQPLVAPVHVATDETYALPEAKSEQSSADSQDREPSTEGGEAPAAPPARATGTVQTEARKERKRTAPAARITQGLDGADAIGGGASGAGAAAGDGRSFAQPPPPPKAPSSASGPSPRPEAVAPPVWAQAPAQAPAPSPKGSGAYNDDAAQLSAAPRKPAARAQEERSAPQPARDDAMPSAKKSADAGRQSVSETASGVAAPAEAEALDKNALPAESSKAYKADEKNKDAAPADTGVVSVTLTREQGGRARVLAGGEIIGNAGLLKVNAQGGKHVTVVGVRRDGVPYVYGQMAASAPGQPISLVIRLRPTSARTSEALFVIVGDTSLAIGNSAAGGPKDAAQLPLRLQVSGTQRRYVLSVSAVAD